MEVFFEQIIQFFYEAEFGTANETYALYVVERFEVCISNVRQLKAHISENEETSTNVGEVVDLYQSNVTELLQCLELLSNQWTEYYRISGLSIIESVDQVLSNQWTEYYRISGPSIIESVDRVLSNQWTEYYRISGPGIIESVDRVLQSISGSSIIESVDRVLSNQWTGYYRISGPSIAIDQWIEYCDRIENPDILMLMWRAPAEEVVLGYVL